MRRLNEDEVKRLAEMMEMPLERARAFAEILFSEKEKGNSSLRCADLDSVDGYFQERENNWYFYHDWQALIQSEIDQADAGLTEKECEELMGKMIFKLPDGWYAHTVL